MRDVMWRVARNMWAHINFPYFVIPTSILDATSVPVPEVQVPYEIYAQNTRMAMGVHSSVFAVR